MNVFSEGSKPRQVCIVTTSFLSASVRVRRLMLTP